MRVLLLRDALTGALEVVRRLRQTDWDRPTVCSLWSTRDVLNHIVATTTKFSAFAAGETDSPRTPRGDLLGEDPMAALEACCATSVKSWQTADLRRTCRLPFGTLTAPEAAAINAFDVSVHTWDTAQAANLVHEPSTSLTALAYGVARQLVTPEAVALGQYADVALRPKAFPRNRGGTTFSGSQGGPHPRLVLLRSERKRRYVRPAEPVLCVPSRTTYGPAIRLPMVLAGPPPKSQLVDRG